jgi:hypothetical protein
MHLRKSLVAIAAVVAAGLLALSGTANAVTTPITGSFVSGNASFAGSTYGCSTGSATGIADDVANTITFSALSISCSTPVGTATVSLNPGCTVVGAVTRAAPGRHTPHPAPAPGGTPRWALHRQRPGHRQRHLQRDDHPEQADPQRPRHPREPVGGLLRPDDRHLHAEQHPLQHHAGGQPLSCVSLIRPDQPVRWPGDSDPVAGPSASLPRHAGTGSVPSTGRRSCGSRRRWSPSAPDW